MSIAPLTFTGVSSFSNDFQTILTRAVQIANLPVTALTNHQTDIQSEKVLASGLSSAIAAMGTSLGSLATLGTTPAMTASSTDSSVVTATASGATSGATYAITNVTSIARVASETSLTGYAGTQYSVAYKPLTGAASNADQQSLTFTINDSSGNAQTTTIQLAGGTAGLDGAGAAKAINTALQATGNASLMGLTATANSAGDTISFAGSATSTFTLGFGDVSGVDTTGGFASVHGTVQTSATVPVSTTGTMQLNIGGTLTPIVLTAGQNNLAGLRDAINNLNLGVTASIVATGTGGASNYLTVSAKQTGLTTLTLVDDPTGTAKSFLSNTNQGANTVFQLNGLNVTKPTTVVSDVVSGVSFTFDGTTATNQTVDVSLASDSSKISSALQSLVSNYNTLSGLLNAQIGSAAGLLSGNPIIAQTRQAMFSLLNSGTGSGTVQNLTDLGIELDNNGVMSLNSDTFNALSTTQIADAYTFLGSKTAGPTSMQAQFTQLSDPTTGTIQAQETQWDATDTRLTAQVSALTDRINLMQTTLQSKLQVADSLLASLASTQTMLTSSIQSLNFSSYGYNSTAPTSSSSSSS
jgi:flagellar hook-associated protein 2